MRTWIRTVFALAILAIAMTAVAQGPVGETPPRPAPPNRPDLPGAPPKEFDDIGYCIVAGPASQYCAGIFESDCVPIPTSLQVPVQPEQQDLVGWSSSPNSTQCGTEPCFIFFRCACGATLLNQVCGA